MRKNARFNSLIIKFMVLFVVEEESNGRVGLDVLFFDLLVVAHEKLCFEQEREHLHQRVHFDLCQVGDVFHLILGLLVEQQQNSYLKCRCL